MGTVQAGIETTVCWRMSTTVWNPSHPRMPSALTTACPVVSILVTGTDHPEIAAGRAITIPAKTAISSSRNRD